MKIKQLFKRAKTNVHYAFRILGNCSYCVHNETSDRAYPCNECLDSGTHKHFEYALNEKKTLYICDREKCETCNPDCEYTSDIKHAAHFYEDNGYYLELPQEVQP